MKKKGEQNQIDKKSIEELALYKLKEAKLYGNFPTSIDKLARKNKLRISMEDLSRIDPAFQASNPDTLQKTLNKVRGFIDIPNNDISVDQSGTRHRIRYTSLHEIGHGVIPWQRPIFERISPLHLDYDKSLSASCKATFELEANYFSACSIFQCDISQDIIFNKPLNRQAVIEVADIFDVSFHATARHFMENTPHKGILLLLNEDISQNGIIKYHLKVKQYLASESFKEAYPKLKWYPNTFNQMTPFVRDAFDTSINSSEGSFFHNQMTWHYEYFTDSYTHFVLVTEPSY